MCPITIHEEAGLESRKGGELRGLAVLTCAGQCPECVVAFLKKRPNAPFSDFS